MLSDAESNTNSVTVQLISLYPIIFFDIFKERTSENNLNDEY